MAPGPEPPGPSEPDLSELPKSRRLILGSWLLPRTPPWLLILIAILVYLGLTMGLVYNRRNL
jgi:hypothetical protein